eukprot:SAG31_NODE_2155_length_6311_cov_3.139086_3_plen_206_part_00
MLLPQRHGFDGSSPEPLKWLSSDLQQLVGEHLFISQTTPFLDRWKAGVGWVAASLTALTVTWPTILRYLRQLQSPLTLCSHTPPRIRSMESQVRQVAGILGSCCSDWGKWAVATVSSFTNAGYGEEEIVPTLQGMSDAELLELVDSISVHYSTDGQPNAKAYFATYEAAGSTPQSPLTPEGHCATRRLLSPPQRATPKASRSSGV